MIFWNGVSNYFSWNQGIKWIYFKNSITFWRNFQKSTKFDFTKKPFIAILFLKKSLISHKNQKDKIIHFLVKLPQLSFRFSLFSFDHFFLNGIQLWKTSFLPTTPSPPICRRRCSILRLTNNKHAWWGLVQCAKDLGWDSKLQWSPLIAAFSWPPGYRGSFHTWEARISHALANWQIETIEARYGAGHLATLMRKGVYKGAQRPSRVDFTSFLFVV